MANYTQSGYDPSTHGYWRGTIDNAPNFGYPQKYFYADTLRSVFLGFGNFFNDIKVIRYNEQLEPTKVIDVPIKWGPRMKSHDFRTELESGKKYYISLPNLTYRLESMEFAAERAKGIYEQRAFYTDELINIGLQGDQHEMFWSDVQPTPYNLTIGMELKCEKLTDAEQAVEQICARFNPACFFDLKEFWFFNKRRSIKMKLNSTTWNIESDDMGEEQWRQITVSFSFTLEIVLYKPIRDARIIQKINTYLTVGNDKTMYHGALFGNSDGSLMKPYNFSEIYGTKIDNAYVLDGVPKTTFDPATSAYTTKYEYTKSDQLTTYDSDAKLLMKSVTRWVPASENMSAHPSSAYRHQVFVPTKYTDTGDVYSGERVVRDFYADEWMTINYYKSLSGYGKLDDMSVDFGSKVMTDQYGNQYSAYYSKYSEEGTFTSDPKEFEEKKTDFYYSVDTDTSMRPNIEFSGGKYSV